jgi:membrane protein implicated in regulation of membrane protease activity
MFLYWFIMGAVLIFLELVVPGGIVVLLGAAALLVGSLLFYGAIETLFAALITWFISSLVFIFGLRGFFMKYFEGDSQVDNVDEDSDLIDSVVEVVEIIYPHKEGRVRFRDTTWNARSDQELAAKAKARIVKRDGNTLVVQSF